MIFLGRLSVKELSAIYQKADIMVYPSIFEGFGLPILESLFSKTPVITSKEGCFKESGGDHSIYIDPLSIDELIHAIKKIRKDKNSLKEQIEKGWIHAQKFTDEKISQNLIKIYKDL